MLCFFLLVLNETEQMFNTIVPKAEINVSCTQGKRKKIMYYCFHTITCKIDIDNIIFGSNDNNQTPISIPYEHTG